MKESRNFCNVFSPLTIGLATLSGIGLVILVFRPTLTELAVVAAVDIAMVIIMGRFDYALYPKIYRRSRHFFCRTDWDSLDAYSLKEQRDFIQYLFRFPGIRTRYYLVASMLKVTPAIMVETFYFDTGAPYLVNFGRAVAISLILVVYVCAAVFVENHRRISSLIDEIDGRLGWQDAFRMVDNPVRYREFGMYEAISLLALMSGLLVSLGLSIEFRLPNRPGYLILEIFLTFLTGAILASRIWYLYRNTFAEALLEIHRRFEVFRPNDRRQFMALSSIPVITSFQKTFNGLLERLYNHEIELTRRVYDEAENARFMAMGELSSLVIHDLASPLQVFSYCAECMVDNPEVLATERFGKQMIISSTRAIELVESLKAYLKNPDMNPGSTNIAEAVAHVQKLLEVRFGVFQVAAVQIRVHPDVETFSANLSRPNLIHVLMNIIENACRNLIDNQVADPEIIVSGKQEKQMLHLRITDNGTGLSKDRFEEITGPSYIVSAGYERRRGLGLRLVRRLIESCGGSLDVLPKRNADCGTTFLIVLPAAREAWVADDQGHPPV